MIILELHISHGQHVWYAASIAMPGFVGVDYLRLADSYVNAERGRYEFRMWETT